MSDSVTNGKETRSPMLGAGAMTAAERVVAQLCQFAVFVVAARVLGPAEFGIFALVSACAILLFRAAEVGWAPYIMCWAGDAHVPRQVLSLTIGCGFLAGATGAAATLLIGNFWLSVEIETLMLLFSLWLSLATISSAQKGMMIWMKRLRLSAVCEITGEVLGSAVSILALWSGHGVLSLAYGRLTYQITHLTLSFLVTRTTPQLGFETAMLTDLWVFSKHFFFSRMLANTRLYVATFIVGGAFGPTEVGYFRVAERLVGAVGEVIAVPAQLLGWAIFKDARDGDGPAKADHRIRAQLIVFVRLLWAISVPLFIWLIVVSDVLIANLLSAEWLPAVPLIMALAAARLLATFGIATEPLLSLLGQSRQLPFLSLLMLIVSTLFTLAAIPFGLHAVALAQLASSGVLLIVTLVLFKRFAGVPPTDFASDLVVLIAPLMLGVVGLIAADIWLAGQSLVPPLLQTVISALVALAVYAAALALLAPQILSQLLGRSRALPAAG